MNKWRGLRWLGLLLPAVIAFGIDQASKAAVIDQLAIGQSWAPIPMLQNIFEITRSVNTGAAFGLFQGANVLLLLLSAVMAVGIVIYASRLSGQTLINAAIQRIALGLLLGGVIGNGLDRLRLGTVVDFIHWQLPGVVSNVSNLADHAIVFAVIGLLVIQWRTGRQADQAAALAVTSIPDDGER